MPEAADEVEPEAALADMIGGDKFLRRNERRMHGAKDGEPIGSMNSMPV